ncbi:MAG: serine hydrolase [Clostridia bacterium]|nr:serine hydrolase [Clostridia bacterium]
MEAWIRRVADFAIGLALTERSNPSVIPYRPSKTEILKAERPTLPRVTPRALGMSERRLLALLESLEGEKSANVHSLMVVKNGCVALECSAPGYSVNMPHLSHSMSKVLTSLAIGLLVDGGRLSVKTPICELFPEYTPRDKRFFDITVEHLLTMSTGVRFSEAGVVSENEWTRAFFESDVAFVPGSRFEYNSMNTYILGRVAAKLAGMTLTELVRERILLPLGITSFFWECGPEGFEKGGFGAFLSLEGWVKIALLILGRGRWRKSQILSPEWIAECTRAHRRTPDSEGRYDYGYQIWVSGEGNLLFSGMLGQAVLISPKSDTVIAVNSGNNELFQSGRAFAILDEALASGFSRDKHEGSSLYPLLKHRACRFFEARRWVKPRKRERGLLARIGMRAREPYPPEWNRLLGRFDFIDNNIGLLPVFVRAMQNNFGSSVSDISFVREGGRIFFVCRDGGRLFKLEVGFYGFCTSCIDVSGEKYVVSTLGGVETEGDGVVYKLELLFPELPNTRRIEMRVLGEGALSVRFSELPDERLASTFSDEILKSNSRVSVLIDIAERRLGGGFIGEKIKDTFSRTLVGARVGSPYYDTVLDEERRKRSEGESTRRMLEGFLERYLRENETENECSIRERVADIFDKVKEKLQRKKSPPQ